MLLFILIITDDAQRKQKLHTRTCVCARTRQARAHTHTHTLTCTRTHSDHIYINAYIDELEWPKLVIWLITYQNRLVYVDHLMQ